MIGRKVGNYRVEKLLGAGGMGEVYLVRHAQLPNTVAALKVMKRADDAPFVAQRFVQEALVAAAIGGHRVARPLDLGRFDDGAPYILMELVEGQTLASELQHGPLAVDRLVSIAYRIADTVAFAHARGIVHRDLKPSNIMLVGAERDRVKLLDFGVARAEGELKLARTRELAIVGSPGYLSPEAASGGSVAASTDVFSLGVVIYQMATGELPFPASVEPQALAQLLTAPAPVPSAHRPVALEALPPEIDELVAVALAKEPGERPTMAALRDRLCVIVGGEAPSRLEEPVAPARPADGLAPTITHVENESDLARLRKRVERLAASRLERPPRRYRRFVIATAAIAIVTLAIALWPRSPAHRSWSPLRAAEVEQHQLTFSGTAELIGLSPDGRTLCYSSGQRYHFLEIATGTEREAPSVPGTYMVHWLADSSAIEVLTQTAAHRLSPAGDQVAPHTGLGYEIVAADGTVASTESIGKSVHIRAPGGSERELPIRGDYAWIASFAIAWSPDARQLLVMTLAGRNTSSGPFTLWALDVASGEQRMLAEAPVIRDPQFVQGGSGVVYLAGDAVAPGTAALMYVRVATGERHAVIESLDAIDRDANLADLSVGAGGNRLVYLRRTRPHELWLATLGAEPVRVMNDTSAKLAPRISPDGSAIAYLGADGRDLAVYVASTRGKPLRRIAAPEPRRIAWSPAGDALAVLSAEPRLAIYPLAGGAPRALPVDAISPDGLQSFAWAPAQSITVETHDKHDVAIVDPSTGSSRLLFHGAGSGIVMSPQLSEDAAWIAVWRNLVEAGDGLWLLSVDGREQRELHHAEHVGSPVAWSADRRALLEWRPLARGGIELTRRPVDGGAAETTQVAIPSSGDCSIGDGGTTIACTAGAATDVWMIDHLDRLLPRD